MIRIPAYKTRVEIQGQVKRPGIFEVLPGENFSKILSFASGFTDTAYEASIKVYQKGNKERMVHDLFSNDFSTYQPQSGDIFVASKILNRFGNRVRINGSVFRPDVYELTPGLKAADLIRKADGLKEDAYTGRGQIIRLEEDLTRSVISFDITKALAGDPANNPELKREDELFISSTQDLKDHFNVTIQGEVKAPGNYDFVDNLTLKDLILQAGGFRDAAFKTIEIARMIKRDSILSNDNRASTILNLDLNGDLSSSNSNMRLEAYDVITVRRKAGYTIPELVRVSGQVQFPGPYALENRSERVSQLLQRAGGYTPDAYPDGAYLKRFKTELEKANSKDVISRLKKNINDTTGARELTEEMAREYDQIPIALPFILSHPGAVEDINIRADDELFVPKFNGQVKISGAVLMVTQVPFREQNKFKDYINEAGGFAGDAWRKKAYLVYANGKAATTSHFLFFKFYPKIQPGCELIVPKKPEKKATSTGEVLGIASAMASLAGVVIAILKL